MLAFSISVIGKAIPVFFFVKHQVRLPKPNYLSGKKQNKTEKSHEENEAFRYISLGHLV
jgi:hypothetical protein